MEIKKETKVDKNKKKKVNVRLLIIVALIIVVAVTVIILVTGTKDASKPFFEAISSNSYYMVLNEVDENYVPTKNKLRISKDGDDLAVGSDTYVEVIKGGDYYRIFHDNKTVIKTKKGSSDNNIKNIASSLVGKKADSTKKVELKGVEYTCETYGNSNFYFQDSVIKYIESEGEVILVTEFSGKANKEMFEIPDDYSMSEI